MTYKYIFCTRAAIRFIRDVVATKQFLKKVGVAIYVFGNSDHHHHSGSDYIFKQFPDCCNNAFAPCVYTQIHLKVKIDSDEVNEYQHEVSNAGEEMLMSPSTQKKMVKMTKTTGRP